MSRRAALLLRVSVVWAVWVWVVLIRNMIVGNFAWSFKAIHIVIAIVSLAFAVATWRITTTSRRFTREVERQRSGRSDRLSATQMAVGAVRLGMRKRAGRNARSPTTLPAAQPGPAVEAATGPPNGDPGD